jgi:hypothetical protein
MGAGWMYYHSSPPNRKCPECGKRVNLVRIGRMSNGADLWEFPAAHRHASKGAPLVLVTDGHGGVEDFG